MKKMNEQATQSLLDKNLISEEQFRQIQAYRSLNIFSLHNELRFLLYLSVLLFTGGIGILIYQNIDTIGHIAILSLLLIVTVISFYFCFKNAAGFKKEEVLFPNSLHDYLVLTAVILSCTFIGYLQFQYKPFGTDYGLATLIPTLISFICAYYFDNKSVLTIAITGLAAYIGLSVTPQDLVNNDFYSNENLSYSAILLSVLLILWTIYSSRIELKTHFNTIYLTFALHIISIAAINNLVEEYWFFFAIVLAGSSFYFYKTSYGLRSISLYVFMIIYAYIGINIVLFKIFEHIDFSDVWMLFVLMMPVYFIGSIILFVKLIKNFNKEIA
jgi:hypothetical protein